MARSSPNTPLEDCKVPKTSLPRSAWERTVSAIRCLTFPRGAWKEDFAVLLRHPFPRFHCPGTLIGLVVYWKHICRQSCSKHGGRTSLPVEAS
jgi:hypothetical protein